MKLKKIITEVPVTIFKEGNKYIAYTPALDISTFGNTFEQARSRFIELVQSFLEETLEMGTLDEVLQECGWQKVEKPQKHWIPPHIIAQVQEEIKVPVPN